MRLEDQCCTLAQGIKLNELGIRTESLWCWIYPQKPNLIMSCKGIHIHELAYKIFEDNDGDEFDAEICGAWTVAELGLMLPTGYDTMSITTKIGEPDTWHGYDHEGNDFSIEGYDTEAQCRAAMVIHLLEAGIVTSEEINNRLKSNQ